MAITSAIATSFKVEILKAVHNFTNSSGNTFKVALIKANASQSGTYGAATTSYTDVTGNSDELANGNGYATGGVTLVNTTPSSSGTTAHLTFTNNAQWTSATFTTRGCIIYNDSATGDPAVAVFDFGGDKTSTAGSFTISFPTADASNAVIRIA